MTEREILRDIIYESDDCTLSWAETVADHLIKNGVIVPPCSGTAADPVNNPSHYTSGRIECIDYIEDKLTDEEFRGYIKGNAFKYLTRERLKGSDEDILKAKWYLDRLAEKINGGAADERGAVTQEED